MLPTRIYRGHVSNPVDPIRQLDTFFGRLLNNRDDYPSFTPYGVDIREDEDHYYVDAELPGFKREQIDITLENQTLSIVGEREQKTDGDAAKGNLLLHERRYNRFQRSFNLPPNVDEKSVEAKLVDGVLTIVLNKREESKPRKINVS